MGNFVAVIEPSEKYLAIIDGEVALKPVITTEQLVVANISGPQGPAGPGDKNYVHDQMVASTTWTINHSLGKFPSVMIVNSAGEVVEGFIQHVDNTQAVVTFTSAFAGKAYLN